MYLIYAKYGLFSGLYAWFMRRRYTTTKKMTTIGEEATTATTTSADSTVDYRLYTPIHEHSNSITLECDVYVYLRLLEVLLSNRNKLQRESNYETKK